MSSINDAAKLVRATADGEINLAVVLGSGLSDIVAGHVKGERIEYADLPGMPRASLAGHAGHALVGTWHAQRVLVFAGRVHLYQGFSGAEVTIPVAIAAAAGAKTILLTNAAGGLDRSFEAGDLMLIRDQLNFTGTSPGIGVADDNPFVNMVDAYDPALLAIARECAAALGIPVRVGVYAGLTGPAYETPAEAAWLRGAGASAAGMSTVLETIRARRLGLRVGGISLITNIIGEPAHHAEVVDMGKRRAADFARLLSAVVERL